MSSNPSFWPSSGAERFSAIFPLPDPQRKSAPKGPLSAWQRWEMNSIAEKALPGQGDPKPEPIPLPEPVIQLPVIDEAELERIKLQAQEDGRTEGHNEGFARGMAEGHAASMTAVHEQADHFRALVLGLSAALSAAGKDVAGDLSALAMDIARQLVGQALTANPEIVVGVVRELLQSEPALTGAPQLVLHPDDAALVREHLAEDLKTAGWRIRPDPETSRGGCRVLATSGERDATLETRWQRVAAALNRHMGPPAAGTHD